jgi:hypothetical protein
MIGFTIFGQSQTSDSLRNPNSQYYLTDLNLRDVAQLIVSDSIQPRDNVVTFNILDSIVDGNESTRNYFADAFDAILNESDGALAEVLGQYCIRSIYYNQNELLVWLSSARLKTSPESIAQFIAYELVMSSNPNTEKKELINRIINYPEKKSSFIDFQKRFVKLINKEFKRQLEE